MTNYYPKSGRCRACTKLQHDCSSLPFHTMPVHSRDGSDAVVICSEFVKASNVAPSKSLAPQRIYLSGPMTGLPECNYPAFHAEAARLRALGYHVENPAENPPQDSWEAYMAVCIPQMRGCDTIALLPGWSESRGALCERQEAVVNGMNITPAARVTARRTVYPYLYPAHKNTIQTQHLLDSSSLPRGTIKSQKARKKLVLRAFLYLREQLGRLFQLCCRG